MSLSHSEKTSPQPIWLISGCSTGFGRELAKAVVARGWHAVLTARDPATLKDIVAQAPDRVVAQTLDVTQPADIAATVALAERRFGGIDVLVNNAGYGYRSTVEEAEDALIRDMFETNLFGLIHLTRAVLPILRRRQAGHIINIGSVGGIVGGPLGGYYCASKHAVEGLSKSLALEVRPFGIKVTVVEPGPFRTDFSNRSFKATPMKIADYVTCFGAHQVASASMDGKQPGDPARAAEAIIEATLSPTPPFHLALGRGAVARITEALQEHARELEQWREVAIAADFPTH